MKTLIKFLLSILFLPIVLIVDNFKTSRSLGKKILLLFVILLIFGITWINGYRKLFQISEIVLFNLGIRDKIVNVNVRGQSMLPTINDGDVVTLHSPKKYTPEKGDIVSFSNIETSGQYYIKRIIAMEGETISLENGAVKVNGNYLVEDYVYKNSPTYGNTFLMDCRELKVPKGKVAVMGDNRIASTDSRVIGFVNLKDIEGVIKTGVKPTEVSTHVGEAVDQETINKSVFLGYLNERRSKKSLGGLREVEMLTDFATEKANFISENIDTWKSNSVDLSHAIEESGYDFLLVQEVVTMGKYDEEQLVNHLLGLVPYDQDFLSDKYIDIGIGISETNIGTCSTPIFVIILGWPTNPGYSKEQVSQWDYNIEKLSMLVSILRDLKQNPILILPQLKNSLTSQLKRLKKL
jgi:signal peptidase I